MGIATLAALDENNAPIKVQVNAEGQLVVATATTALSIALLDKLDTIITRLEAVEAAVNAS